MGRKKKLQQEKVDAAEIKMLRWSHGVWRIEGINNRIRGTIGVTKLTKKIQERRSPVHREEGD